MNFSMRIEISHVFLLPLWYGTYTIQGLFNYTPVHWYNRAKQNITYKCVKYLKYHSCTYVEIIFDITWQNNDYSNTP